MSATEIIQELPKLSLAGRRAVRGVLSDRAAGDQGVQLGNQVAIEAAMMVACTEQAMPRIHLGNRLRIHHSCDKL